jgi:hypothetical protein
MRIASEEGTNCTFYLRRDLSIAAKVITSDHDISSSQSAKNGLLQRQLLPPKHRSSGATSRDGFVDREDSGRAGRHLFYPLPIRSATAWRKVSSWKLLLVR